MDIFNKFITLSHIDQGRFDSLAKGDGGNPVFSEGGGVQGRVFKDIESGFFANIHIKVQLTFFVFGGSI